MLNCTGCNKLIQGNPYREFLTCATYHSITAQWRRGRCPMAPWVAKTETNGTKVRVGQQKQKKAAN